MSTSPTICFLTGTLNAFAGAERMTAVIASALAERGYRVFVLSLWDQASVFPLHPAVCHHALFEQRPSFKRVYASTVGGIRHFLRKHGIGVLVEVDTMLTLFTIPATLGMRVRRIAWEHCHFDQDLGRRSRRVARRLAAKYNDAIVVLTERDKIRWIKALKPRGRMENIPNPLPEAFPSVPSPQSACVVLAVGRLTPAKGFDVLLRAWPRVLEKNPSWTLQIVGEGEERPALETLIDTLQIRHAVSLPGARQDISKSYANASIFCLSSRFEGYGLALIEAMAHGLAIVSTDCEAGPRELLQDGINALTVPVDNAEGTADAILRLIEDPDLAVRLGQSARSAVSCLTTDGVIPLWEQLLGN